jgi:hypothetical protein
LVLLVIGLILVSVLLLRQIADPNGQYAFDFQAYYVAAANLLAGRSPYAPKMFTGPIAAQGAVLYKYPPLLAQLLMPLTIFDMSTAAAVWLVAQASSLYLSVLLALRYAGRRVSVEAALWAGVAVVYFMPAFQTVWMGNVSGPVALFVALMLQRQTFATVGASLATLTKGTAVMLVAPIIATPRRHLLGLFIGALIFAASIAISPGGWLDYVRVLPNLLSGPAIFVTNFAPDELARFWLPSIALLPLIARLLAVFVAVAAIGFSIIEARRANWSRSVSLAVFSMLLLPTALWYHYLCVFLPLAAYGWVNGDVERRAALIAGMAMITIGLAWFPLVFIGGVLVGVALIYPDRLACSARER